MMRDYSHTVEGRSSVVGVLCGIVSLLVLYTSAHGQRADLRGVVSDSLTGERIPYANVMIAGTSRGAAANLTGFYLIPNVPPGSYEVIVSVVGYETRRALVRVSDTAPITLNFRLVAKTIQMGEMIVTREARAEYLETRTSVHIIDRQELRRVPVTTQGDIFRSILVLPGIVSTSDVSAQFHVRGGSSDQNLILLDGMKIYHPFHAFGLFSSFDPEIIRTTEVHTGGFPPEFGGSLSSVMNILTRDGNASRFEANTSVNLLSSRLQIEGPLGEGAQMIASARKSLFSQTLKRFLRERPPLSFYDGFVKLAMKGSDNQNRYTAQVFASGDELEPFVAGDPSYEWATRSVSVQADFLSEDRLFWSLNTSISSLVQTRHPNDEGTIPPSVNRVSDIVLRGQATYYSDTTSHYYVGFEFSFPKTQFEMTGRSGTAIDLSSSLVLASAWIQHVTQWGPVSADVGLRAEATALVQQRSTKSALQPRVNVSVALAPAWKAKVAVGRFSQELFTVTNENDIMPIFIPWIAVPEALEAEWADHLVLGIEGKPAEGLLVNTQAYYKRYGSLVTYNRDKIEENEPDYINAKGEAYGGELLVRYDHELVNLHLAYTLGKVHIDQRGFLYAPRYDRRHTVNLLCTIHPLRDLDLSLRWEFGSGLPFTQTIGFYDRLSLGRGYPGQIYRTTGTPIMLYGEKNSVRLPTYHRLDASLQYRFTVISGLSGSVGVSGVNLYDRKNLFYFEQSTGRRVDMLGFLPSASLTLSYVL